MPNLLRHNDMRVFHIEKIRKRLPKVLLSKRQQFVLVTLILTSGLIATQLFAGGLRFDLLFLLSLFAYVLSALVLHYDLSGWEFITLLTLPTLFTAAAFVFYFLLPTRWLTRLPFAALYAVGMYAILLTENIFNVAAERNIQLLRAAHSVGFLLSLVTIFFLIETILSLHLPFYLNVVTTIVVIFPLSLQALWSMELTSHISKSVFIGTSIITLVLSEFVLVFSFWPVKTTIAALFITTLFYTLIGMTQQYLIERLFQKTIREFVMVAVLILLLILITTRWGAGQ